MLHTSIARQDTSKSQKFLRANRSSIECQDSNHFDRIRNIRKVLKTGEKVLAIALQPRMLPGSSHLTPNIIYATNSRILIVDPHVADVREENVSIPYDVITSIKLEEAPYFTLAIKFESPTLANAVGLGMIHGLVGGKNRNERIIDTIPREKAEELMHAILCAMSRNRIKFRIRNLSEIKVRRTKYYKKQW